MVSSGSCVVPTCQMHQCELEHWSFVVDHVSRPYNKTGTSGRGVFWYPAWCLTSRFFSSKFMQDRAMPIRRRTSPLLPPEESIIQRRPASTISTCPSAIWTVEQGMDGETWSILVFDQFIWRPKTAASFLHYCHARTSTSSISASSATSSTKSRSVNTSFPKVTPAIPWCAVRSIIWTGPLVLGTSQAPFYSPAGRHYLL